MCKDEKVHELRMQIRRLIEHYKGYEKGYLQEKIVEDLENLLRDKVELVPAKYPAVFSQVDF